VLAMGMLLHAATDSAATARKVRFFIRISSEGNSSGNIATGPLSGSGKRVAA